MARRIACSVFVLALAPAATLAGPLAPDQCEKLTAQVAALDQAGVKAILEKGPAAAKGSLTKERRDQIRAYLDGLGQLRFRCPNDAPFVTLKAEPPDDPADVGAAVAPIEAGSPGITLPAGVAAAVVAPIVPKKPAEPKAAPAAKTAKPAPPKAEPAKAEPPKAEGKPAAKAAAPPASPPAAAPPAAPAAAQPAAAAPPQAPPQAKPKAAPKAKADDAFRPGTSADGKASPADGKAP
jgi:hypothetical protein